MNTPRFYDWSDILDKARSIDLARAGLVCGTVALAVTGIGASLYLQDRSQHAPAASNTPQTIFARPGPRLPRARPDEPATTGSINPAVVPLPSLEDEIRSAGSLEAEAEAARIERLRGKAVLIASSWVGCSEVTASEVLQSRDRPVARVAIRIACGNEARFDLDEEEIEESRLPAALQAGMAELSDAEAVDACEQKVRSGLPHPSSLHRSFASTGIHRAPGSGAIVTFDFDALNGLGFPLSLQAQCVFDEHKLARLEVNPR